MSNALTLARPYARAAFELAKGEQAAAAWSAKLGFAAQVIAQQEVQALIGSPKLGASDRVSLFLPQGEAADSSFARFLNLLEHNQRLPLLGEIASLYEDLRADDELNEVEAQSAKMLAERDDLTEAIRKLRGAIGNLNREGRERLLLAVDDLGCAELLP